MPRETAGTGAGAGLGETFFFAAVGLASAGRGAAFAADGCFPRAEAGLFAAEDFRGVDPEAEDPATADRRPVDLGAAVRRTPWERAAMTLSLAKTGNNRRRLSARQLPGTGRHQTGRTARF